MATADWVIRRTGKTGGSQPIMLLLTVCAINSVVMREQKRERRLLPVKTPIKSLTTWRTEGDSNPRYALNVYTLSRRAPSTARPPVRCVISKEKRQPTILASPVERQHPLDVPGNRVDLKVYFLPGNKVFECRHRDRVGDQVDTELAALGNIFYPIHR